LNQNGFLRKLFRKSWEERLTPEEEMFLQQWLAESKLHKKVYDDLSNKLALDFLLHSKKYKLGRSKGLYRRIRRMMVAACLLVAAFIFTLNFFIQQPDQHQPLPVNSNLVLVKLADGTFISPDTVTTGLSVDQGSCQLMINNKEVRYTAVSGRSFWKNRNVYNEISIPVGKQFTAILPDSSKVVLNAASSSIRFPLSAAGDIRNVELTGEGYFDIQSVYAGKNKIPFVVKVKTPQGLGQEVTVTGTSFNINAYGDENNIKTALFDGQVIVECEGQTVRLSPSEELCVSETRMRKMKKNNDISHAIAWKEGDFLFYDVPIQQVIKEISRWYDCQVEIEGEPTERFFFLCSRSMPLEFLLKLIFENSNYMVQRTGHNKIRLIKRR
jgi:transmembrane sensor